MALKKDYYNFLNKFRRFFNYDKFSFLKQLFFITYIYKLYNTYNFLLKIKIVFVLKLIRSMSTTKMTKKLTRKLSIHSM